MRSPGIRELVERCAEAVRAGRLDALGELIDPGDEVLIIGTDPRRAGRRFPPPSCPCA